ncbi:MAG: hypothetical protein ACRYGR_01520 [Janthinobacterium lividum]
MITALFKNPRTAENAYQGLINSGYKSEDITFAMSEGTKKLFDSIHSDSDTISTAHLETKATEGLGIGAALGGSIGAIAAAIAAIGTSLVIPGLGIIVAGSLAAGLAGAGAGAATGGLLGALIGYGIPDDQAKIFEAGLNDGGVVIGVKANSEEEAKELHRRWSSLQHNTSSNFIA